MLTESEIKSLTHALLESNRATKWDYEKRKVVLTDYYQRLIDKLKNDYEQKCVLDELNKYAFLRLMEAEKELKIYENLHKAERYKTPWEES